MKLRDDFVTYTMADTHVMVPVGEASEKLHGIVKSNETAAFIIECLKNDTTVDGIVDKILEEYEVDRERAKNGVLKIVEELKKLGAIEE